MVDLAAAEMFEDFRRTLEPRGIELRLAAANEQVRDLLVAAGPDEKLGDVREGERIASVIDHYRRGGG